jgi:hypothetical protein
MRFPLQALAAASLIALMAVPPSGRAVAQTPPPAAPAGTAAPAPSPAPTPAPTPAARTQPRRETLVQRFGEANTTHDGHLTKTQASAAKWPYIVNNFDSIDKDHKGFVSVEDIRGYAAAKRAARRAAAGNSNG